MVANVTVPPNLMSIPATSAHLWPAGTLPAGSVTYPGRIFVGGLTSNGRNPEGEVTEEDLTQFFGTYGTVTDVKMIQDHEDGTFRGYAFVTFADTASADKVLEIYSDSSQRQRFVIKGLDLKMGHAVKKGNGPNPVPNPAAIPNPLLNQMRHQLYNQQLLQALYCNPYSNYLANPVQLSPDPMLSANLLYASNPAFALPQAVNPNLAQVTMSTSPIATQSRGPTVSSALIKPFDGQSSPTSRNGFGQEIHANEIVTTANHSPQIPITTINHGIISPITVPSTVMDMNSASSPALINSYNLRCPNPLAYPYGCVATPPVPGLPNAAPQIDQNYLNSFYCYPPQHNGAYLGSSVAGSVHSGFAQQLENHNQQALENYQDSVSKANTASVDDQAARAMAFSAVAQPTMQVHFANTSHVDNLSLAGLTRPLATSME